MVAKRDDGIRVCQERCESCLYRLHYPKETRDRILADVAAMDGFVQCHTHDKRAAVICRGYFDAFGISGGAALRLAITLQNLGHQGVIEWVAAGMYPPPEDEEDGDG